MEKVLDKQDLKKQEREKKRDVISSLGTAETLWKNASFCNRRCAQGKPAKISYLKLGIILIIISSVEPACRKDENMFLNFNMDLSN